MSLEESRKRDAKERRDRRKLMRMVAAHLTEITPEGEDWTFRADHDDLHSPWERLKGPDGMSITADFPTYGADAGKKVHFSVRGPKDSKGNSNSFYNHLYSGDGEVPKAGMSRDRGPEALAKDLVRRVLPEYRRLYAMTKEKIRVADLASEAAAAYEDELGEFVVFLGAETDDGRGGTYDHRLAVHYGSRRTHGRGGDYGLRGWMTPEVKFSESYNESGMGASFTVSNLSAAKVKALLAVSMTKADSDDPVAVLRAALEKLEEHKAVGLFRKAG